MFTRTGWCTLALAMMLSLSPARTQARPPDLPVDPRVACPEGEESVPQNEIAASQPEESIEALQAFDAGIRSIYVPVFKNDTERNVAAFDLTQAVIREIERVTPFKVVARRELADTELSGTIVNTSAQNRCGNLALELIWRDLRHPQAEPILTQRRIEPDQLVVNEAGVGILELVEHRVSEPSQSIRPTCDSFLSRQPRQINEVRRTDCEREPTTRARQLDAPSEILPTGGFRSIPGVAPLVPQEPAPFPDVPFSDDDLFEEMLRSTRPLELVPVDRTLWNPSLRNEIEG